MSERFWLWFAIGGLFAIQLGMFLLWDSQIKMNKHAQNLFLLLGKKTGLLPEDFTG